MKSDFVGVMIFGVVLLFGLSVLVVFICLGVFSIRALNDILRVVM